MTVIGDQRKQHKSDQKDYKRPKKWPKDEQNDQNDNDTKLSRGANKITINETDKNENNDHWKSLQSRCTWREGKPSTFFHNPLLISVISSTAKGNNRFCCLLNVVAFFSF